MEKAMGTVIVALAIGALLGFGGGYYYMQPQVEDAFASGMAYQSSVAPAAVFGTPGDLEGTWDDDTFDHSATVDVNGNIAVDFDITHKLTIENEGTADAESVWIMLYNPVAEKYGLDEDLEYDETKITIEVGGLSKLPLYKDGEYTDGYEIGDIPAGAEVEISITVSLLEHDDEDYPDDKSLDCEVYIYQPGANYADSIDFTVDT